MTGGTIIGVPCSSTATNVRKEVAAMARSPENRFSETTLTNTSMLVRPVQVTYDSRQTESDCSIGRRKSTESVEAVMTLYRQCRTAEMEANSSMALISLPPNRESWLLTSFGNTRLVLNTRDSRHSLGQARIDEHPYQLSSHSIVLSMHQLFRTNAGQPERLRFSSFYCTPEQGISQLNAKADSRTPGRSRAFSGLDRQGKIRRHAMEDCLRFPFPLARIFDTIERCDFEKRGNVMIDLSKAEIQQMVVHQVGSKAREEGFASLTRCMTCRATK